MSVNRRRWRGGLSPISRFARTWYELVMRTPCAALLAGLLLTLPAAAADDTRYAVLMTGRPAGHATWSEAPAGTFRFALDYNDRGRGPKLDSVIRLRDDGMPASLTTSGNEYMKAAVAETFTFADGRASWKNRGETGDRTTRPAFYASFDGTPQELALLVRALQRAPGGRLPLLPAGEATLEKVSERVLTRAGRSRTVTQYAIGGLDFTPTPVWLSPDGRLFAAASSWLSVVEEGWEGELDALLAEQDAATARRSRRMVDAATRVLARPLAFRGVRVFDADAAVAREDWTVVVRADRIVAAGPAGSVAVPPDAEIVDGAGKTLLPGLWDMHTHVQDVDGPLNIAAGITSVRDMANVPDQLDARRTAWESGTAVGPRVIACGFIDGPGPYQGPTGVLVATAEEAEAAVAKYAALGYRQIKLYSSLKPELVPVLTAAAHARGMRVSGHIPAFMTADQAIRAGYDEIQHVNMLFLNFWGDTVKDTRTPLRFTAVAEKAADLDLASAPVSAFIGLLEERKIVVDPTLSIFEEMFTARAGHVGAGYAGVVDRLPVGIARGFLGGGLPVPQGQDEQYRKSFDQALRMTKRLYDEGIPIVAGTDALAGFALHRELELYVQAGIPAPRVLQIATLGAARIAEREASLGSIAAGKLADLTLVDGDPLTRISDVRRTTMVVKGGRVYDPAAIYRAIGVRP